MKFSGFLLLAAFSVAVHRVQGSQHRVACILIPAYDPEDFAEGENEEEEIRGWGPGNPGGYGHNTASGGGHAIVTYTQEREEGEGDENGAAGSGGLPPTGGSISNGSWSWGSASNPMTDPSKPPGPNPKWGYWEWDAESGRWETEDFRRKRKRRHIPVHVGHVLKGKLQCGPGTVIHVDKVTLGFSINNYCSPVRPVCQATSTLGRQVAHCEGQTGTCDIIVAQKFLKTCGRRTNYARIHYECIAEADRHNICDPKSFAKNGSIVLASPSYSGGSAGSGANAQILSCECEVTRGGTGELSIPYARTKLATDEQGNCGDETVLLDAWDSTVDRFALHNELCGLQSLRDKVVSSTIIKVTYIPSSVSVPTNGFLVKIQGNPDPTIGLWITCSLVKEDSLASTAQAASSSTAAPAEAKQTKLPANFDIRKYPGDCGVQCLSGIDVHSEGKGSAHGLLARWQLFFFSLGLPQDSCAGWTGLLNKTLEAYRNRMLQQGSASGQVGTNHEGTSGQHMPRESNDVVPASKDEFDVKGTSGTLSAVVASLSSIILVMGSLGAFLVYRRHQKKKKKEEVYYDSRSTVRSSAALYTEATYQDPTGPGSSIPSSPHHVTPLPPSTPLRDPLTNKTSGPARRDDLDLEAAATGRTSDPVQRRAGARKASCDGELPALPRRPPRPNKNKMKTRCLPEEDEEDVVYDNNADGSAGTAATAAAGRGVVTLLRGQEEDYASLTDLTNALQGGTSVGKKGGAPAADPDSEEEEEEIVTAEVETDE